MSHFRNRIIGRGRLDPVNSGAKRLEIGAKRLEIGAKRLGSNS